MLPGVDAPAAEWATVILATVPIAVLHTALLVDVQTAESRLMDPHVHALTVLPMALPAPVLSARKDTAPLADVLAVECKRHYFG
jgi:hypothetical protein